MTPREARALWVERLIAPDAPRQACGRLAFNDERCCLGVACDLAVELGVIDTYNHDGLALQDDEYDSLGAVRDFFGLRTGVGLFQTEEDEKALSSMNDNGSTFAEIAEVIMAEPPGLVTDATD